MGVVNLSYVLGSTFTVPVTYRDTNGALANLVSSRYIPYMVIKSGSDIKLKLSMAGGNVELRDQSVFVIEGSSAVMSALTEGTYTYEIKVITPAFVTETVQTGSLYVEAYAAASPVGVVSGLTNKFLAHYQIAPANKSATAVHAAITMPDAGTLDTSTGITNPDFPRVVTVKGNAAGIAGNAVITGTNFLGVEITDTIALNGAAEVNGAVAFKTVTKITLPAKNAGGDTVSVGVANIFGLPHIVGNAACLLVKLFNGSADLGTLAVDNDEIEKNLFTLAGTPDGAKKVDLYYIV